MTTPTLFVRIGVAAAATIAAAMASYGIVAHHQQRELLLELATHEAESSASDAAEASVHHLLLGDYAALDQLLLRLARHAEVEEISVLLADGLAVSEVQRASPKAVPTVSTSPRALVPPALPEATTEVLPDRVVAWQPVEAAAHLGWIRVAHRLDALHAAERALATSALALAAVWSAAATLLLLLLLRRPVVSIRMLADFARRLGLGKAEAIEVPSSSPEIAQLATALSEASRELRENETRLLAERQLLDVTLRSIADGVVATDAAGRVVLLNDAAEALAACPPGRAVGRRFCDLFPNGDAAPGAGAAGAVGRILSAGRPIHLGEQPAAPAPDGRARVVAMSGAPVVGGAGGAVLVLRDVTAQQEAEREHRRLQQAFEQAQKLESVGRLAGGVAHDFNNVLTVILGNVELALMHVHGDHPLVLPLAEMREAAEGAAALTRQLLAFSRKSVIEPQVVDLDERLERMGKMFRRLIGEDVVLRLQPGRAGHVRVDPGQLEQILINLAVNARDAMPRGGDLVVRSFVERIAPEDGRLAPGASPGEFAVIEVSDTGCGMPEEVKAHVFEPFFTTKEKGKGTGLGLATVYGAVTQNHGFIEVDSEVGHGTTFRVHLPRALEPSSARGLAPVEPLRGGHETILLVEDEAPVRRLATRALEEAGYRVIACASGDAAKAASRAERGPIHLILSDVVMPGMDGPTLVRALASQRPDARVLFVSGYFGNSSEALERAVRSGASVLGKPFTPATLTKAVRAALDAAPGQGSTPAASA